LLRAPDKSGVKTLLLARASTLWLPLVLALAAANPFPACGDGVDNDGDGLVDWPSDPGCTDPSAGNESPGCSDGVDNDGDGLTDFPADPGCTGAWSVNEDPECSNGLDDDGDGKTDWPEDPSCSGPDHFNESTQVVAVPLAGWLTPLLAGLIAVAARVRIRTRVVSAPSWTLERRSRKGPAGVAAEVRDGIGSMRFTQQMRCCAGTPSCRRSDEPGRERHDDEDSTGRRSGGRRLPAGGDAGRCRG